MGTPLGASEGEREGLVEGNTVGAKEGLGDGA